MAKVKGLKKRARRIGANTTRVKVKPFPFKKGTTAKGKLATLKKPMIAAKRVPAVGKSIAAKDTKQSAAPTTDRRKAPPQPAGGRNVRQRRSHKLTQVAAESIEPQLPPLYLAYDIVDAVEFHELSRAMGVFTWSTWDVGVRPFEERKKDFLYAFPPTKPVSRTGGRLQRQGDGSFAPGEPEARLARFLGDTWDHGSINELLSRFGLKLRNATGYREHLVKLDALRDVAKRRNVRLRVLHGGVDVEPANMDAAKAEYLDRQEKQQAARDVRAARTQMKQELLELDQRKLE